MKLEFEQNIIPPELYEELDFKEFLSLFDVEMPLIPQKTLRCFCEAEGKTHFDTLRFLQKQVDAGTLDLETVIEQSRALPLLDFFDPGGSNPQLEQFHLFPFGRFAVGETELQILEKSCPVSSPPPKWCSQVKSILETYTQNNFSGMRLSAKEELLRDEITKHGQALREMLLRYEKSIYQETGLKMTYPFPKEIAPDDERVSRVRRCPLLSITEDHDILKVEYRLPPALKEKIREKESVGESFDRRMREKLDQLNQALAPFIPEVQKTYHARKDRAYLYLLLWVKNRHHLTLPQFHSEGCLHLTKAALPALQKQRQERYVPLDIELSKGANVLFGANMTGKTTVLKTLYFHLTAIRMGLPVPAEAARLYFPSQVMLHLKSPGRVQKNTSGFGEEIGFFTQEISPNAYVMVDELFHSTDPVNGIRLSRIFLSEFSTKDLIFFCTSHYPEVLAFKDVSLYFMKDAEGQESIHGDLTVKGLLDALPFILERISPENLEGVLTENKKPLYTALRFPLPESIKEKIRRCLKG